MGIKQGHASERSKSRGWRDGEMEVFTPANVSVSLDLPSARHDAVVR